MWEGKDGPQPDLLSDLSQTWKEQHPDWTYIFWNGEKIDAFMAGHAEYRDVYNSYPYAVQRWDMIRYLILYEYGGIYADLDYECIDALDSLLENEFCCLASDPEEHARIFDKAHIVTNAFIAIEAAVYGIGTYIRQMVSCLTSMDNVSLHLVQLNSDVEKVTFSQQEGYEEIQ